MHTTALSDDHNKLRDHNLQTDGNQDNPPMISTDFPNWLPRLITQPQADERKYSGHHPIKMAGYQTKIPSNPRLIPTAKASMLTAMESRTSVKPRDGSL